MSSTMPFHQNSYFKLPINLFTPACRNNTCLSSINSYLVATAGTWSHSSWRLIYNALSLQRKNLAASRHLLSSDSITRMIPLARKLIKTSSNVKSRKLCSWMKSLQPLQYQKTAGALDNPVHWKCQHSPHLSQITPGPSAMPHSLHFLDASLRLKSYFHSS